MISREAAPAVIKAAKGYPVVAITGPRQSGKTTLSRMVFADKPYTTLEDPDQLDFALSDPRGFLQQFPKGAVLDEIQRAPKLFSYIQGIVDEQRKPGLFILTGSQHFGLLAQVSQTLAGRVATLELLPFSFPELKAAGLSIASLDQLLFQGQYPALYDRHLDPLDWYADYIRTYVERDVRQITAVQDLNLFQTFVRLCAARVGQVLDVASIANDAGVAHNTARAWISVLEASYVVYRLTPHHRNFSKRLIKRPKLYFYDTGLVARLLGIRSPEELRHHPLRGSLFESWVVSEVCKWRFHNRQPLPIHFWREHKGKEIDLLIDVGNKVVAVEVKAGATINSDFFRDLEYYRNLVSGYLKASFLVYGGDQRQTRLKHLVVPWTNITELTESLASK
jgi:predicted AAA+ superfamily ATPase